MKDTITKIFIFLCVFSLTSCGGDFLDVQPTETITTDRIDELGKEAITPMVQGLYSWLINLNMQGLEDHNDFGYGSIMLTTDLMTSDMVQRASTYGWFYPSYKLEDRARLEDRYDSYYAWNFYYKMIYSSNEVIKLLSNNETEDEELLAFKGQAYAMRAFAYLNLAQLFQQKYVGNENTLCVPIVTDKTAPEVLRLNPRASVKDVYTQIEKDLLEAHEDLKNWNRTGKSQVDAKIVSGLLARMYLNMEQWDKASSYANAARTGFNLMTATEWFDQPTDLGRFIDLNNQEWMWASDITSESDVAKTGIINLTSHLSSLSYGYASIAMSKQIDKALYDQILSTDVRKKAFASANTRYTFGTSITVTIYKYDNLKFGRYAAGSNDNFGDIPMMRTSEMLLIEAEGLAMQGKSAEAIALVNQLLASRGNPNYTLPSEKNALRDAIVLQRRIELWGEGFSLNDFKRLGYKITRKYDQSNHPLDAQFNLDAFSYKSNLRIPQRELDNNQGVKEAENNK